MTELIAAIAGIIGTVIISVFTYLMARRAGIGPYQDTLVSKLKDLVDLQTKEITGLKEQNTLLQERVEELEKRVEELGELTINQAIIISKLTPKQQKMIRTEISSKESDL
jgi:hypothetical protein